MSYELFSSIFALAENLNTTEFSPIFRKVASVSVWEREMKRLHGLEQEGLLNTETDETTLTTPHLKKVKAEHQQIDETNEQQQQQQESDESTLMTTASAMSSSLQNGAAPSESYELRNDQNHLSEVQESDSQRQEPLADPRLVQPGLMDLATYKGEHQDGKPHGRGFKVWQDGDWYDGEWRYGKQHGRGSSSHPTTIWEGGGKEGGGREISAKPVPVLSALSRGIQFTAARLDGATRANGRTASSMARASRSGPMEIAMMVTTATATATTAAATTTALPSPPFSLIFPTPPSLLSVPVLGEWREGKQHGKGTYTWANGDRYEGEWKDGNVHGKGTKVRDLANLRLFL